MGNNPIAWTDPDGGEVLTDFVNTKTGEIRHVEDGSRNVVTIDDENWNNFLSFFDATSVLSDQTWRTTLLSKFGVTYMVDDFLKFYDKNVNPNNYEHGSYLYKKGDKVIIGPENFTDNRISGVWADDPQLTGTKAHFHIHYSPLLVEGLSDTDKTHKGEDIYNVMISSKNIYFYNRYQERLIKPGYSTMTKLTDVGFANFTIPRK